MADQNAHKSLKVSYRDSENETPHEMEITMPEEGIETCAQLLQLAFKAIDINPPAEKRHLYKLFTNGIYSAVQNQLESQINLLIPTH